MGDEFASSIIRQAVTLLCYNTGYDSAQSTAVDILSDILRRQFLHLAKSSHNHTEHYGRTETNLDDVALALKDANISVQELEEYVQNFDPVVIPNASKIPMFPVKRESKMNFLRPGSEEVLTRPVHVHEYMPAMIFEKKEESPEKGELTESEGTQKSRDSGIEMNGELSQESKSVIKKEMSPEKEVLQNGHLEEEEGESSEDEIEAMAKSTGSPSKFVPFSTLTKLPKSKRGGLKENPALKRVRMMLEEDGHPVREVKSAMMTTSGFLTSSREGRLPDTRPPANREFFDPLPPPPPEKKKKPTLTMKRIVEGVKKIDKEKEINDFEDKEEEEEEEEPQLFGNPDQIVKAKQPIIKEEKVKTPSPPKIKKKLKIDKEMIHKINLDIQMERERKQKLKMLKRGKKNLDLDILAQAAEIVEEGADLSAFRQGEEELDDEEHVETLLPPQMMKIPKIKKGLGLVDPVKLKKLNKHPLLAPPRLGAVPGSSRSNLFLPKGRGRSKRVHHFLHPRGGVPLPDDAIANLGRGLMDSERPLRIKKSHMEPDMRSLIPEVQLDVSPASIPPPMQRHRMPPNELLMGLPSAPGLIPSGNYLPPPPPLIKMPTPSPTSQHLPPSIQITPATPSTPSPIRESKLAFSNVCSSVTITPIDFGQNRKPVPPLRAKPKEKPPVIKEASGLTITPIVMDEPEDIYAQAMYPEQDEYNPEYEHDMSEMKPSMSMLLSKEERRKRKELKKMKKRDKDKDRDRDKKKDKDRKKLKKEKHLAEVGTSLSVPKLTLKLSGLSGTPTPVGSPNPPIEDMQRPPSPELAKFSPLVTRPPKTPRAAKEKAAAAVAAEAAMGSYVESDYYGHGPLPTKKSRTASGGGGGGGTKDKKPKSRALVTETVGCILDEQGNKVWICPQCGRQDDGSPMIGCDRCDDWYHFICVGITEEPPENSSWFCPRCKKKKKDKMK